ncbi:ferritin [Aquimarina rubra]|uniref:Ferritin n=1 Tax=Aquimarina rubra TaxID=1920033 RepID=A0ABW5LL78_9FLAO
MIPEIEKSLNEQVRYEATASAQYLSMACWADVNGYNGIADFFYTQSEEERVHMTKLVKFINERNGQAVIPAIEKPRDNFKSLRELFEIFLESEEFVTAQINNVIFQCLEHKDYNVHNFMQWYVAEQLEEEAVARTLLDKLKIIGDDKSGHYLFDRDINTFQISNSQQE